MTDPKRTGGCLCGAIRYSIRDDDTWNVYCHCESCRRHTGAPVVTLITCHPEQVTWTAGERVKYESSPDRYRTFCATCGTSLSWEAEVNGRGFVALHVSTADDPERYAPSEHVFVSNSLSWFETDDAMQRYPNGKHI